MQPPTRCPRCGYPLTYDEKGYKCQFCGYPKAKPPLANSIRNFEQSLRVRLDRILDNSGKRYERMRFHYPPYRRQMTTCLSCGLQIPAGLQVCPYCGAPQNPPSSTLDARANNSSSPAAGDQQVLDYISAHGGTISVSQAAKDLGMTTDALRTTLERLKSLGLLKPA
jgi:ribosomal protein L37E